MEQYSVEDIFQRAVLEGCSDVHLKPGSPPKMRKNGRLIVIPGFQAYILTGAETSRLVADTMDSHALPRYTAEDVKQLDYSYDLPEGKGRFRMNAFKTKGNDAVVGRLLAKKAKTLDELGVPSEIKNLTNNPSGLIIVSGATGSGKSTTLAGMIDYINSTRALHIISIEDPIEVEHSDAMSSITQREVGVDVHSFEDALKDALREDPDVILIGEVRTLESLKIAIRAADTGHLVVTTLHTTDASKTINRIITTYPAEERDLARQQLSAVLRGIVAQRLVPNKDGTRTVVNEILLNTPEVAQKITDGADEVEIHNIIEESARMTSFEQRFLQLIEAGQIDLKTALFNSIYPEWFEDKEIKYPNDSATPKPTSSLPPIPGLDAIAKKTAQLPQTSPALAPLTQKQIPPPRRGNPKNLLS